jgi:hypothetical protein
MIKIHHLEAIIMAALGGKYSDIRFLPRFDDVNLAQVNRQNNIIIVTIPRSWPLNLRDECKSEVRFELWVGVPIALTDGDPSRAIEIRDMVIDLARGVLDDLMASPWLEFYPTRIELFDFQDGQSLNAYAWGRVAIDAIIISP